MATRRRAWKGLAALVIAGATIVAIGPNDLPVVQAGGPGGQNDAGSGQDAGDEPSLALLITSGTATLTGSLAPPGTDHDWYRHSTAEAFCSKAESTMSSAGRVTIAADALQHASASRGVHAQAAVSLALAAPSGHTPYLGIEPGMVVTSSDGGPRGPGRYTFRFQSLTLGGLDPEGDGEVPEAGATTATAVAVPDSCFAGRLSGSPDLVDRYYVDVDDAREITLSFAIANGATDARLEFVTPSGAVAVTVANGEAADVYASEPGRWNLVVSRPLASPAPASRLAPLGELLLAGARAGVVEPDTDYLIGITDGPDPCRPAC